MIKVSSKNVSKIRISIKNKTKMNEKIDKKVIIWDNARCCRKNFVKKLKTRKTA